MITKSMSRFREAWSRWPLLGRILLVQGGLLVTGAALFVVLIMGEHREESIADQNERSRLLLLIAVPLVAEQAVTGDLASAQQLLERQAVAYSDVSQLVWRASGRDDVGTRPSRTPLLVPAWFRNWLNIPPITRSAEITLGGNRYGDLEVTLAPTQVLAELWQDFQRYLWFAAVGGLLIFVSMWQLLRIPLRAMLALADAADKFGHGQYGARAVPEGAFETRKLALAFNSMAERMQQMVTQLLESKGEMREQLHFTEELIEALPVPMYYKNTQGAYLSVNRAWEKLFAIGREEIVGRTVRELYAQSPEVASYHEKMDHALMASPGVQNYELPLTMRDGRQVEALYSKATVTDTGGRVVGLIGIITDLTELNKAETQAREAMLQKASAEQASVAKSMFLANMSHEIRTPLTAIIGFSEAMLDVNQTMAERIEAIRTIHRAGKHLHGIINDILDLSKIEAGKLEVECVPVPVLPMVEDVAAIARLQAEDKGLYFKLEFDFPLPWTIHTDPLRVKQVLLNVVGNALKFTERGGVTLRLRHEVDKQLLVIEVEDTGIGINPEQIGRLFQPFAQADATTTRRFGGTGLGLVLSKQLAEMLGGTVLAASVPGQGSHFYITLATGEVGTLVNSLAEAREAQPMSPVVAETESLAGVVLLAEDNLDNQRLVQLNMRRLGAELVIVDNGEAAVAAALARPFDLILMDMQMPVMDGLTAVRLLREKGYAGAIVALTANATAQDVAACIEAGCDDFLSKPIERARFTEALRRHLLTDLGLVELVPESSADVMLDSDLPGAEALRYFAGRLSNEVAILRQVLVHGDLESVGEKARDLRLDAIRYRCVSLGRLAGPLEFSVATGNQQAIADLLRKLDQLAEEILGKVPPMAPGGEEPIVSELIAEGPEMLDLVAYFLARLPGYQQGLNDALAAEDLAAMRKLAHDIKGVGGGYGYPQITELGAKLEAAAKEGRDEEVAVLVGEFGRLAKRIEAGAAPIAQAA